MTFWTRLVVGLAISLGAMGSASAAPLGEPRSVEGEALLPSPSRRGAGGEGQLIKLDGFRRLGTTDQPSPLTPLPKGEGNKGQPRALCEYGKAAPLLMLALSDSFDPLVIAGAEKRLGIRIAVDRYPTAAALLAAAKTQTFDVALLPLESLRDPAISGLLAPVPAGPHPAAQTVDPVLSGLVQATDPKGPHGLAFDWYRAGLAVNTAKVTAAGLNITSATVIDALTNPSSARRLADCGMAAPETADTLPSAVLTSVARDPAQPNALESRRLLAGLAVLRDTAKRMASGAAVDGLATGTLCAAWISEPEAWQAKTRAASTDDPVAIDFVAPEKPGRLSVDSLVVAKASPHVPAAWALIDHLLTPGVAGRNALFGHVHSAVPDGGNDAVPRAGVVADLPPALARSVGTLWRNGRR